MSKFSDLPENTTPLGTDLIAIEEATGGLNKKVQFDNMPIVTDLASTATGKGASLVGVEDIAGNFTATTQEGVNAELFALLDGLDSWVSATTYTALQDVVILTTNNKIYRCIVTNSDVTFTPANWQAVGKDSYTIVDDAATGSNQTLTAPTTDLIRLTSATLVSIDMIPAGETGNPIWLINDSSVSITINNETGATAAQKIKTGTGAALVMTDQSSIQLIYDTTDNRWQVVGGIGGGSATNVEIVYIKDTTSAVTNRASTAATWNTRILNTVEGTTSLVSLSANRFTLQAGKYSIECWGQIVQCSAHQTRLVEDPAGTPVYFGGESGYLLNSSAMVMGYTGEIDIVSATTYELQHYTQTGISNTLGADIYATTAIAQTFANIKITKIG